MRFGSYVVLIVLIILFTVGLRTFALQSFSITSASMEPTLCGGAGCSPGDDRILVNKLSYRLHDVHRGDVVVFSRPHALDGLGLDKNLVKRAIAVAGDSVRWERGALWINDVLQHESYLRSACTAVPSPLIGSTIVPRDELFVMGDNRCNSEDSRIFGSISSTSIVGEVFIIYWPGGRIGTV